MTSINVIISPSILSKTQMDFENKLVLASGFEKVHIDIADGKFVKNKSIESEGIKRIIKNNKNSLLGAIRRLKPVLRSSLNREFLELKTVGLKSGVLNPPVFNKFSRRKCVFEFHLMTTSPLKQIYKLYDIAKSGDFFVFHVEAVSRKEAEVILNGVRKLNKRIKIGIALNPETMISSAGKKIDFSMVDEILIMTVHPGYSAQEFIPECLEKIGKIKKINPKIIVEVDGGINKATAKLAKSAGADVLVSASAVFKNRNVEKNAERLLRD
ncbi:MAG TPA: hypothetical protein VI894_02970 [Candidatus Nanoarchaeia archaeon]|nr:hypothetical protein [Candidatus Nanoarchaeia archaeon]